MKDNIFEQLYKNLKRVDVNQNRITKIYSIRDNENGNFYKDGNLLYPSANILDEDNKEYFQQYFDFEDLSNITEENIEITPAKISGSTIEKGSVKVKEVEKKDENTPIIEEKNEELEKIRKEALELLDSFENKTPEFESNTREAINDATTLEAINRELQTLKNFIEQDKIMVEKTKKFAESSTSEVEEAEKNKTEEEKRVATELEDIRKKCLDLLDTITVLENKEARIERITTTSDINMLQEQLKQLEFISKAEKKSPELRSDEIEQPIENPKENEKIETIESEEKKEEQREPDYIAEINKLIDEVDKYSKEINEKLLKQEEYIKYLKRQKENYTSEYEGKIIDKSGLKITDVIAEMDKKIKEEQEKLEKINKELNDNNNKTINVKVWQLREVFDIEIRDLKEIQNIVLEEDDKYYKAGKGRPLEFYRIKDTINIITKEMESIFNEKCGIRSEININALENRILVEKLMEARALKENSKKELYEKFNIEIDKKTEEEIPESSDDNEKYNDRDAIIEAIKNSVKLIDLEDSEEKRNQMLDKIEKLLRKLNALDQKEFEEKYNKATTEEEKQRLITERENQVESYRGFFKHENKEIEDLLSARFNPIIDEFKKNIIKTKEKPPVTPVNPGDDQKGPEKDPEDENDKEKEIPKKGRLKVIAKKALNWMKEHKLATIAIGLALTTAILFAIPQTHMMINSALWNVGKNLGWSAGTLGKLHSTNLGLSTLVKGGAYTFEGASGLYTLGGAAGAKALYTAGSAKLVGALAGLTGLGAIGTFTAAVVNKIKNRKKKKQDEPIIIDTEGPKEIEDLEEEKKKGKGLEKEKDYIGPLSKEEKEKLKGTIVSTEGLIEVAMMNEKTGVHEYKWLTIAYPKDKTKAECEKVKEQLLNDKRPIGDYVVSSPMVIEALNKQKENKNDGKEETVSTEEKSTSLTKEQIAEMIKAEVEKAVASKNEEIAKLKQENAELRRMLEEKNITEEQENALKL